MVFNFIVNRSLRIETKVLIQWEKNYFLFFKSDKIRILFLFYGSNKSFIIFSRNSFWTNQPYPKPTQVNKFSKLRRLRELCWRNSAKWLRNFGIRSDFLRATLRSCHIIGDSDCLLKTQVSANSQEDVLKLTPAQCCKIKGKSHLASTLTPSKRRL